MMCVTETTYMHVYPIKYSIEEFPTATQMYFLRIELAVLALEQVKIMNGQWLSSL